MTDKDRRSVMDIEECMDTNVELGGQHFILIVPRILFFCPGGYLPVQLPQNNVAFYEKIQKGK